MRRRSFGARWKDVPILGEGTWNMEADDRASAVAAIRRAIDLGTSHVDTAEMYGSGRVESIVGEAIAGRRDQVFLVSKVLPSHASYEGTLRACEASLRRLKTDRLDVYLLHWPGSHPLEETIRAFETLVKDGKTRAWGVSNFDERDLERALAIAGPNKIACNQVLYHLKERAIEHAVVPWCETHDVAVVAYSPFGSGDFPERDATLEGIAKKHGATSRQVALAFLVRRASTFAIPKSSAATRVEENAGADGVRLDDDDLQAIDRAFPRGRSRGLPTL